MSKIDIAELEKKADELKIIPFLSEMINFIKEVKPIVDNVNLTITDNVKKVPKATQKLTKVTEATELATNEILNTVDGITLKSMSISELLGQVTGAENQPIVEQANNIINDINGDSMAIMMALQVQDITSQQIAAVNHLLTTMQRKLNAIVQQFNTEAMSSILEDSSNLQPVDDPDTNISTLHREIAFDPEAIDALTKRDNRQDEVDELMKKHADGTLSDEDLQEDQNDEDEDDFDVDDIDSLFAAQAGIEENNSSDDDEVSADDIDALFGGGDADDDVSQDDIDALFNQ